MVTLIVVAWIFIIIVFVGSLLMGTIPKKPKKVKAKEPTSEHLSFREYHWGKKYIRLADYFKYADLTWLNKMLGDVPDEMKVKFEPGFNMVTPMGTTKAQEMRQRHLESLRYKAQKRLEQDQESLRQDQIRLKQDREQLKKELLRQVAKVQKPQRRMMDDAIIEWELKKEDW